MYPPRFSPCAESAAEYPALTDSAILDSALVRDDRLFVSVPECNAVLEIEPSLGCVAVIPVQGTIAFSFDDLQALDVYGDTLLVGGEEALLYRASPWVGSVTVMRLDARVISSSASVASAGMS